jgi:EAL domain-containing protein (putative c-di-GMP-specific phosphodiesterase class I)/CheY-like chemotaxis protein
LIIDPFSFEAVKPARFGHRRLAPRVCIVDGKPHIRTFLASALEELGFITGECACVSDVTAALADDPPDVIVLGLLIPESEVTKTLHVLSRAGFAGKVMLFGGRASTVLLALHDLGEQVGLAMLPPLRTPFRDNDLRQNLSEFLPIPSSPSIAVDVEEALRNGWLELWYQPKIDLRQMSLRSAEALVRMRHPTWGVVPPASFIPGDGDPQLRALSEFVVGRAMADWAAFVRGGSPIEMTIHLPMSVLEDTDFIDRMCLQLPIGFAPARLTVEISSVDVGRNPELAWRAAKQLETYNVGISIDDVAAEASWADIDDFPIAELQVDRSFVLGCANDQYKRAVCSMILKIAERLSARANAKGIENTADFQTLCDMGFELGQGFLFAKPLEMHKFARTMLRRRSVPAK